MIRIQLIHEGRIVKTISSRVHESVILEQVKKYNQPIDEIRIVNGELSEAGKGILQRVAKRIIPAAMAAGMAMSGTGPAQAQGGANPHYPGLDHSIGQHLSDIFSPNYQEIMRQRNYERSTQRQVWDAEQNEIRRARIEKARQQGRIATGQPPVYEPRSYVQVYDQARVSNDGKWYFIYSMDNTVIRIPVQGTEFMPGDSQRLPHYIAPNGRVLYVRHPAGQMKESIISEGTWALPETPEQLEKLKALMAKELIVGPDATNATEQLYDLVGDDKLFGRLGSLADKDPRANAWNDTEVMNRLAELGVDTGVKEGFSTIGTIPASGTGGRGQSPTGHTKPMSDDEEEINLAPNQARDNQVPQTGTQQTGKSTTLHIDKNGNLALGDEEDPKNLKESTDDLINIIMGHKADVRKYTGGNGSNISPALSQELKAYYNTHDFAKQFDSDLAAIFRDADQQTRPAQESLNEVINSALKAILDQYADSFAKFKAGGEIDENVDFFDALYAYYSDSGEMPYGTQKARDGDPINWIADRLDAETGMMPVAEQDQDQDQDQDQVDASTEEQASADKNIIMQLRKVSDYEQPSSVTLGNSEKVTIDADTARTILAKFETLKPDGKALMQQTLNTTKGFHELLNYFNKREVHEDVELISKAMKPVIEADARAKRLIKKVFGI